MTTELHVSTVDYHTAGEPFRIVSEGVPALEGRTILDKRRFARDNLDHIRKLLVYEPRGHADMYGCFVTEPEDSGADIACVFFHNEGYSTACGHGTIALVTWALEQGVVTAAGPEAQVTVDVPSGRLVTTARRDGDKVTSVCFQNVPSFVFERDLSIETSRGPVVADISYGGAFYASVHAPDLGLRVHSDDLPPLIDLGREIKAIIEREREVTHPEEPELRDVYGVIFFERIDDGVGVHHKNVTIFADGEVDRSPCGSGTSARLAVLDATGELARGKPLTHDGIVDTTFTGRVVEETKVGDLPAVITEVEGSAYLTGRHEFVLSQGDPVGTGFLLR